jgi:hypothetical protein
MGLNSSGNGRRYETGLNTIQGWLCPQPPKRKAESQLYLFEVTAQEKEIIESGLRECQGRVFGPSGAAAKSPVRTSAEVLRGKG